MTSSLDVFEAAIQVKSMHAMNRDKYPEKRENMVIKEILHKYLSKRSFRNLIHSLQRRADARGSADIIYRI